MLETALKLLRKIEEFGFEAYIVGGFVRDHLLGIESNDVDVCTNARPIQLKEIFQEACLPHETYGSVTVMIKSIRFEITTFRREITYLNNRKPIEIEYIEDFREDLLRRDLLINSLCFNSNGELIDLLGGKKDLDEKVIHTVGDPVQKFSEDSLRILRAIRFSTTFQFPLVEEVKKAILQTKEGLRTLSFQRKKEELDRIFTSKHVREGVDLLLELGIEEVLELPRLRDLHFYEDILGIWAILDVTDKYPFTRNEKEQIKLIQNVLSLDNFNPFVLYQYGPYPNSIVAKMKGLDSKKVSMLYNQLPIKTKSDVALSGEELVEFYKETDGIYLKDVYQELERKILSLELENTKEEIYRYLEKRKF